MRHFKDKTQDQKAIVRKVLNTLNEQQQQQPLLMSPFCKLILKYFLVKKNRAFFKKCVE